MYAHTLSGYITGKLQNGKEHQYLGLIQRSVIGVTYNTRSRSLSLSLYDIPAASPLPAFGGRQALFAHVAGTVGEVAGGAGLRHGVHHPGGRHGVDEGRLLAPCGKTTQVRLKVVQSPVGVSPHQMDKDMSTMEKKENNRNCVK